MTPEAFRDFTGCTIGELRLVTASQLSNYERRNHTLDSSRARLVLQGIRDARQESEE
jgi:hypothetical protein